MWGRGAAGGLFGTFARQSGDWRVRRARVADLGGRPSAAACTQPRRTLGHPEGSDAQQRYRGQRAERKLAAPRQRNNSARLREQHTRRDGGREGGEDRARNRADHRLLDVQRLRQRAEADAQPDEQAAGPDGMVILGTGAAKGTQQPDGLAGDRAGATTEAFADAATKRAPQDGAAERQSRRELQSPQVLTESL